MPSSYELKITLVGIEPPIWRRLRVPSAIPLCCLHDAIQAVMGWTDSHLHQFEKDGKYWGVPDDYEDDGFELIDESQVPLSKVLATEGDSMVYLYDFGDGWSHDVVLEKIVPTALVATQPICLAGERRCPPEDVGGPHGYQNFLEVIFDPTHEEFDHLVGWAGGPFQAEEFSVDAVNETLSRMRWPQRHRR